MTRIGLASSQMSLGQGSVTVERKAEINPVVRHDECAKRFGQARCGQGRSQAGGLVSSLAVRAACRGLEFNADARNLQLFVDGLQVPIVVNGELDGRLDASR